tara:strand:- start:1951 stop:2694 length:744 start_codon:yes stop_codon:yes gene_type:complete
LNFLSLYKRQLLYFLKKKINIDIDKTPREISLEDLFIKYGSDKASVWNKKKGHGYTKFYLNHFKKLKYKKVNILEIGSFAGASAAAFSKFFPNSKIYCLDVNISNFKYSSKKIKVFGLDATRKSNVRNFFKKINISNNQKYFDIIIDDGSHRLNDILIALRIFFKHLKFNGLYIVEDYMHMNFFKDLRVFKEPNFDKIISYIKKKKNFNSKFLGADFQKKIFNEIKQIKYYKGLSKISSIAFITKIK